MINLATVVRCAYKLNKKRVPFIPLFLELVIFLCYSSSINYKVKFGKGTVCNHNGFGILINCYSTIGDDCRIGNNVSIIGQGPYKNTPQIGDRVYIGPGAVIQGPVIIEDDVIIAANSVVNNSVPKYAIVAGVPAKIIGDTRDLDYNIFKDEAWKDGFKSFLKNDKKNGGI